MGFKASPTAIPMTFPKNAGVKTNEYCGKLKMDKNGQKLSIYGTKNMSVESGSKRWGESKSAMGSHPQRKNFESLSGQKFEYFF